MSTETVFSQSVVIANKRGLHARAAAKFVKLVGQFDARVTVTKKEMQVSGLSIMGLMMLAAGIGCSIDIEVSGGQAAECLAAVVALVEAKFDEE